ncbi:MAG: histidinol-phosphatase [Fimbriiglobus sp.]
MNPDWRARYDLALTVARTAGDHARTYFDGTFAVEYKADHSPVTVADREAEQIIRAAVAAVFPDDGFLGEEYGDQPGGSGFRWVIDPIDGTKPFVRGVPLWGTLVGLEYQGEPVAGVAYAPALGILFHALRGDGAYKDGRRIRVTDKATLADSALCFSGHKWFRKAGREAQFAELTRVTAEQRGWGDFYGFALVAQGACELMVDYGVHPWDVSALRPIVEEAGGVFTDWNGVPTTNSPDVIASNGKVHAAALAVLNGPG